MAKNNKKVEEKKEVLTDLQIKVDTEKRIKAFNEEVGKLCEKHQVQLVPVLDGYPMGIRAVVKIVSTKQYEQKEGAKAA